MARGWMSAHRVFMEIEETNRAGVAPSWVAIAILICGCAKDEVVETRNVTCLDTLRPSELITLGMQCNAERVKVRGFLRVGFERRGLWDSKEDIRKADYRNACITVHNPSGIPMDGPVRFVTVSGTYFFKRPSRLVILGACTDAILEIEAIEEGGS